MIKRWHLVVILILTLLIIPGAVLAATLVNSGSCGPDVEWTLDSDGVLTISGQDGMYDFEPDYFRMGTGEEVSTAPWFQYGYASEITRVVVESGMTRIGNYAFYGCTELESAQIGSTVGEIGTYAFENCYNLSEVNIPGSVTSIEACAFESCSKLTELSIPGSVRTIHSWAFRDCGGLEHVTFGIGVECIENNAFSGCSSLSEIVLPGTVTSLESGAFSYCSSLSSVSLGNGISRLNSNVFNSCDELSSFEIPATVISVEPDAFTNCTSLAVFELAEGNTTYSVNGGVLFSADGARLVCYPAGRTEELYQVPSTVTEIGPKAFYSVSNLKEIELPETIESIANYAFYGSGLTGVTVPAGISAIGEYAFSYCKNLMTAVLNGGLRNLSRGAFSGCSALTSATLGSSLEEIGGGAFSSCGKLARINLPLALTKIGSNAFSACASLSNVDYPGDYDDWMGISVETGNDPLTSAMLKRFGTVSGSYGAFSWNLTDGLLTVTGSGAMPDATNFSSPPPWCVYASSVSRVTLSEGITQIGDYAFYDCKNMISIDLPAGLTRIGKEAFRACSMLTTVDLPSTVQTIDSGAFEQCSGLQTLVIPKGVTEIQDDTFHYCTGLENITIPNTVTAIGDWAFADCRSLQQIPLPASVRTLGSNAFYNNTSLISIVIPKGVSSLTNSVFADCSSLGRVTLPRSVTSVDWEAFRSCYNLSVISYAGTEMEWENIEYTGYIGYEDPYYWMYETPFRDAEIVFESYVISGDCGENVTWTLDADGKLILSGTGDMYDFEAGAAPWADYTQLIQVIASGEGVTRIGNYAFENCENVFWIRLPGSLTSVGKCLFTGCTRLGQIFFNGTQSDWRFLMIGGVNPLPESVQIVCAIPETIIDLTVTPDESLFLLEWTASDDTRIFRVYRRSFEEKTFSLINTLTDSPFTSYFDRNVSADTIYYYYVVGVSDAGYEGAVGDVVSAALLEDTTPPQIISLHPKNGSRLSGILTLTASAADNVGIVSIRMACSSDGGDTWITLADEDTDGYLYAELDTAAFPDGELLARCTAMDTAGLESEPLIYTYILDSTGPAVAEASAVYLGSKKAVVFTWKGYPEEDLVEYRISRRLAEEETFTLLGSCLPEAGQTAYAFMDLTAQTLQTYIYQVEAVDICGNISVATAEPLTIPEHSYPSLSLVVNDVYGEENPTLSVYANTELKVKVNKSDGITAVRVLNGDKWEYMTGDDNCERTWRFGPGTIELVAQGTTENPVWEEQNFDPSQFSWENLDWSVTSNVVMVTLTTMGQLDKPSVMLDQVACMRGMPITATIGKVENSNWYSVSIVPVDGDGSENWSHQTCLDIEDDGTGTGTIALTIPTANMDAGLYHLTVHNNGIGYTENESDLVAFMITTSGDPHSGNPQKIENLVVSDDLTCIRLNWPMAVEIDTVAYGIFRRAEGEDAFQQVALVQGRENCTAVDSDVSLNVTYEYYVTVFSDQGKSSEPSETAEVIHRGDTESPMVTKITPGNQSLLSGRVAVSLRAQDNLAVTASVLSYSEDGGTTWTEFARADDGNLDCELDTTALADGEVRIRGLAWDEAGHESTPMVRVWRIDNTGPEKVTGLARVAAASTVLTLKWDNVADEDISCYVVERKARDGSWKQEDTVYGTLGINIRGLAPNTAYTFRVAGVDLCGNSGIYSDEYTAETEADTTAPTVKSISPVAGAYKDWISLSATATDDYHVASITFQMRTETDGEWTDLYTESFENAGVSSSGTAAFTLELEELNEGAIFVRAVAEDGAGNISDQSETAPLTEYIVDRTPPAAPVGVTATGLAGAVEVAWEQGQEPDLGTYTVYRAESEDGEFTELASGLTSLNYFDRSAVRDTEYAYRVRVCDRAGNLSGYSSTVRSRIEPDQEAPVIVKIVPESGAALGPNARTLQVLATDNSGLDSVLVEYSMDGAAYRQAIEESGIGEKGKWITCTLPEEGWINGGTVSVRAVATDTSGNGSTAFECTYHVDAVAPEIASAAAEYTEKEGYVLITWQGKDETDLAGYRIYRKSGAEDFRFIGSRTAASAYQIRDDSPVSISGEYVYRIEALDQCANVSSVSVSCPAQEEPAEETGPKAVLTCDTAMEVGVQYRFDASGSEGEIVAWHFDFGDGCESTSRASVHAFAETGEYSVILTVTDKDGRQDSITRTVTVGSRIMMGTLSVRIMDEDGVCVPGASVYLDLGGEKQTVKTTDGNGVVTFTAEAGTHVVGAVIPNNQWLPAQTRVIVTAGQTTEASMTLVHQEMITGSFETRKMTFEEIVAAGIDVTDPANRNYVRIDLHLTYKAENYTESIPFNYTDPNPEPIIINIEPSPGYTPDGDGRQLIILPIPGPDYELSKEDLSLAVLDVPVGISALKDFFEVKLYIINNASSEFSMRDNIVTLNIPEGLTLMQTYRSESSREVRRAEIRGQTTETLLWILRGDAMGEYHLSADYSGILSRFNEEISTRFEAESPICVQGLGGASVTIEIAEELDADRLYYNVLLENKGTMDLYCPDIETEDELIRMDLFDADTAERAREIRYDAEALDELSMSVAPTVDPDVFGPGALLIKHYVTFEEVQYTEQRLLLEAYGHTLEDSFGVEVEIVVKPLSWFTAYLGVGTDAGVWDSSDWDAMMNNENYIYWNLYSMKYADDGLSLTSKGGEFLWDLCTFVSGGGSIKELFDLDHIESIEALITSAMGISVEQSEQSATTVAMETALNWLKGIKDNAEKLKLDQLLESVLPPEDSSDGDTGSGSAAADIDVQEWVVQTVQEIETKHLGELMDFIKNGDGDFGAFFSKYATFTTFYEDNIEIIIKARIGEKIRNHLFRGIFTQEDFKEVWKGIGYAQSIAEDIVDAAKDADFDMSVALAAQNDMKACLLFLDALIQAEGNGADQWKVKSAAERIRTVIVEQNYAAAVLDNYLRDKVYKLAEAAGKKGLEYINKAASANVIVKGVQEALHIITSIGNDYFNVSETYDIADNIRFLAMMSEDLRQSLATGGHSNEETVRLAAYLLELRRRGEDQVARFGMSQEIIRYLYDSRELFIAARKISVPESDRAGLTNWQAWRDYVEDRISGLAVRLLQKPVYPYGVQLKAPIVTVDYAKGETAQRFSADYEWRVSGQNGWTPCDGEPIPVSPEEEPYVLMVRNTQTEGEERLTAAVLIDPAPDISQMGIQIYRTDSGYLLDFPDNRLNYSCALSEELPEYDFWDELPVRIPEGSYSWELEAGEEYKYLCLRSEATSTQFASVIWRISLERVKLKDYVFSEPVNGTVELIGYNGQATHLIVPDSVPQENGSEWKVVGIGAEALKNHTEMETVWIPDGIVSIGASAFEGCTALCFVPMPESVMFIGDAAFRGCTSLAWASLPVGGVDIGDNAFAQCAAGFTAIVSSGSSAENRLRTENISCSSPISLPADLKQIEESAFEGAGFIAVTIPAGCSSVGSFAFANCRNLRVVLFESDTAEIGLNAFPDQHIVFYAPAGSAVYSQLAENGYFVYPQ